jgi:hypothetical protein
LAFTCRYSKILFIETGYLDGRSLLFRSIISNSNSPLAGSNTQVARRI